MRENIGKEVIQSAKLLPFFCNLIPLTFSSNSVKSLRVTEIAKQNKVGGVQDQLESKKVFETEAVTKNLSLTLVPMYNSTPREKLNRIFSGLCC